MCTEEVTTDKIRRGRDEENFIDYIDNYCQLTPPDKQKGVRELYEYFKKKNHTAKELLIMIRSACLSPSTSMV